MNPAATPTGTGKLRKILWGTVLTLALSGYFLVSTCSIQPSALERVATLGVLRVATINSPTTYYVGPTGPTGFEYDLALGLAQRLGVELEIRLAANSTEAMLWVEQGRVDIAAAGLAISEEREDRVRFGPPVSRVLPQLVYRRGQPRPRDFSELAGRLRVPAGSIHAERLLQASGQFQSLRWEESADEGPEELLYQVANGDLDYTVANSDLISINQRYYPQLRVAFALAQSQDLAWAFPRNGDDSLYDAAQSYLKEIGEKELARLYDRHFGHVEQVDYFGAVTLASHVDSRLPPLRALFESAAAEVGMDWRLLAAMGYQESHWNPRAVSPTGVKGIMMLTLETAALLGIADREDPAQSINGGARYFQQLHRNLSAEISEPDRTWMALAAYNIGLGHLLDARGITRRLGGNPDRWLDVRNSLPLLTQPRWHARTRYGYARGYEAVTYVGNIRTYYDMLVWMTEGRDSVPNMQPEPPLAVPDAELPPDDNPLNIDTPVF